MNGGINTFYCLPRGDASRAKGLPDESGWLVEELTLQLQSQQHVKTMRFGTLTHEDNEAASYFVQTIF